MKKTVLFLMVIMTAVSALAQDVQSGAQEEYDRLGACKAVSAEIEAETQRRARVKLYDLIGQLPEDLESYEEWSNENNDTSLEDIYQEVVEEYKEELKKHCQ